MKLDTKDEICSAMVVYGLLTYEGGKVFITNREIMNQFQKLMLTKPSLGYVDFIFYPEERDGDAIILELKVDDSPENAIRQIKEKNYALRFKGKTGETPKYTGRILAVGISYNRKTKEHACKVEMI